MRFLHTADLHLGLRVTRFGEKNGEIQEARFKSLQKMLDHAQERDVAFVLIAGDLFDDNHVDVGTSRRAFELLEAVGRPVYVIPGNHDPLTADSVFGRGLWSMRTESAVRVFRAREPIAVPTATLFPCPLFGKNSLEDPTRWIPPRPEQDTSIRIGLAHGSLKDRDNLPPDDHLMDRHAADDKELDYLALGHWHSPSRHADRAGVVRTVYPGVHEPMRFRESPEFSIGWSPYSNTPRNELFADDGRGRAVIVTIDRAGGVPIIEEVETGQLQWRDESYTLRNESDLSALINVLARRDNSAQQLLRLHLKGALPAAAVARLDELDQTLAGGQGGVLRGYRWFELDTQDLHAEPTDGELQDLAGTGVVRTVYERLKGEADGPDLSAQEQARQAMLLLYRFAKETRQ